jgi:hypothetical protein
MDCITFGCVLWHNERGLSLAGILNLDLALAGIGICVLPPLVCKHVAVRVGCAFYAQFDCVARFSGQVRSAGQLYYRFPTSFNWLF